MSQDYLAAMQYKQKYCAPLALACYRDICLTVTELLYFCLHDVSCGISSHLTGIEKIIDNQALTLRLLVVAVDEVGEESESDFLICG